MCVTVFLFAVITDRQNHNDDGMASCAVFVSADGMAGCAVFVSAVVCSIFTIMTVSFLKRDY
jgi:hypothetical protein